MKNKSFKRILSIILALVLTLGMLVVPAYAEDDNELEIISSVCVTAVTPTTISVKKINNVYYSLDNTTNWTTDATFAGLYPNTQHKVYYRFGTTGTPKELATVTTKQSESHTDRVLIDSQAPYTLAYTGYVNSFELKNDLSFGYYLKASKFEGYTNLRLYVEHKVYNTDSSTFTWQSSIVKAQPNLSFVNGSDRFVFVVTGLSAAQLNDDLCVTLYADKDGKTYITPLYLTTMTNTAYNILSEATSNSQKTLFVDFLNFATTAQEYFKYNVANPINSNIGTYASFATTTNPELKKVNNTPVTLPNAKATFSSFGLRLDSKISLTLFYTFSSTPQNAVLKVSYNSINGKKISNEYKLRGDQTSGYYFIIDDIPAADFGSVLTYTVYEGNTAISNTREYTIESRALSMINSMGESSPITAKLLWALMKYSHSAKAFFS